VARLPSILAPLPYGGVGQLRNAEQLAAAGAAVIVEDGRLAAELAPTVLELLGDAPRRAAMEAALARLATPDAALRIAGELYGLVK
jgi:UDP-N-acetylglucosamine--N-acetylmuramyl-(pentapeptide) pyrophosphoryl-undecaprenol N-acetylglucosamine transferase